MKWWFKCFVAALVVFGWNISAFAQNIGQLKVDITRVASAKNLVNHSSLIVEGWTAVPHEQYPTGTQIQNGKVINYIQKVLVRKVYKGTSNRLIDILTTGVDPLPKTTDPINNVYPGPIAEGGNYILFLNQVPGTSLYQIVGVWQGVYPLISGKTIALHGFGFPEFNDLTPNQFQNKLKAFTM